MRQIRFGTHLILTLLSAVFACPKAFADWTGTKGQLSLRSDAFISPDYAATEARQYNFISAGMTTPGLGPRNRFESIEPGMQALIVGQFSPQNPVMSSLNVQQLYYQEGFLSIGRKKEDWSLVDEHFNLGLYSPQYKWNPVTPESQGLTGIYFRIHPDEKDTKWGLLLFASLLSIPDQGAGYSLKNGEFESKNPWFSEPPSQVRFASTGVQDRFLYQIEPPQTNKILFNQGYAAELYYGHLDDGFFFQSAYAYKAANQLAMALDGYIGTQDNVNVQVNPGVFFHTLMSTDIQYSKGPIQVGGGAFVEKPNAPDFESKWNLIEYGHSTGVSPFVAFKTSNFKLRAGTLWISEQDSRISGPKAAEFEKAGIFSRRYPFRSAHSLSVKWKQFWRRYEGLIAELRLLNSTKADEFSVYTAGLKYQMDERWSLKGDALFLRADPALKTNSFAAYEDNDSLQIGVSYVF